MPKKKSVKKAAMNFGTRLGYLDDFYDQVLNSDLSAWGKTLACECAVIKLNAYFESLMLQALVGAVNKDPTTLSARAGVRFPKHMTDEVCEFLITGGGYFDFRGRDGLIKLVRSYVPADHYLLAAVIRTQYKTSLERMLALRNYAAHESAASKAKAKAAVGVNLGYAGAWLKRQGRYLKLSADLKALAKEIENGAPY